MQFTHSCVLCFSCMMRRIVFIFRFFKSDARFVVPPIGVLSCAERAHGRLHISSPVRQEFDAAYPVWRRASFLVRRTAKE